MQGNFYLYPLTGPASSTDNAIATYKGTGGRAVQNSSVTVNSGQIRVSSGTNTTPPYSFASATTTGFFLNGGAVTCVQAGNTVWAANGSGLQIGSLIYNAAGTAAAPTYTFAVDTGLGFYRLSANKIGIAANGVAAGYLSYNGAANGLVIASGAGALFTLNENGAASIAASGTNQSITLTPSGTGGVVVTTGSTTALAVSSTGANNQLSVAGSGRTAYLGVTGTVAYVDSGAASTPLVFNIGGTEKARLSPTNGNLLLGGTTDGTGKLQLLGTTGTSADGMTFSTDWNFYRASTSAFWLKNTGSVGGIFVQNSTGVSSGLKIEQSSLNTSIINTENGSLVLGANNAVGITIDSSQRLQAANGFWFDIASSNGLRKSANDTVLSAAASGTIIFQTNASTTALTLETNQNATFAAGIRLPNNNAIQLRDTGSVYRSTLYLDGTNTTYLSAFAGTSLKLQSGGADALTLNSSQNATFAGAVVVTGSYTSNAGASIYGAAGTVANTSFSFVANNGCGMYYDGANGVKFATNGVQALQLDSSQNNQMAGKTTSYNGIATAGNGVVTVQGAARATAQTGANASVATYTVGASDASFEVSANILVTTATTHAFTCTCAYTDEGNTARTITFTFSNVGGTFLTSIANTGGTVPYEGVPLHIRAKASTSITIATTGTFTSVVYNVEGNIRKIA